MLLKKRLRSLKPFLYLIYFLLFWIFTPPVLKHLLNTGLREFQAPLYWGISSIRDIQNYWILESQSKIELIETIRDLERTNAHYENLRQTILSQKKQIRQLEKMLSLPPLPDYNVRIARVAQRNLQQWNQTLLLRTNFSEKIPIGSPVIFRGGVVGRIKASNAFTATVELITNPSFRMVAKIDQNQHPLTYRGQANLPFTKPQAIVQYVPTDITIQPNEPLWLVSSALGGVFPDGLRIGQIKKLEVDSQGLFQSGSVFLDPELNQLSEVSILIKKDPQ